MNSPGNCQREWDIHFSALKIDLASIGSILKYLHVMCSFRIFISLFSLPNSKNSESFDPSNCYPLKLIAHRYVIVDNSRRTPRPFDIRVVVENQRVMIKILNDYVEPSSSAIRPTNELNINGMAFHFYILRIIDFSLNAYDLSPRFNSSSQYNILPHFSIKKKERKKHFLSEETRCYTYNVW